MYVDRAEYLVRLAEALGVETMLLVALAAGTVNAEQAQGQIVPGGGKGDHQRRPAPRNVAAINISTDASRFAIEPTRFKAATRGTVLLVTLSGEGRGDLGVALSRLPEARGLVATSFSVGLCLAERYRPELVLLDLGLASVHAFDACHALAGLTSRSQRLCRVVAGTATVTDEIERPALKAGAARFVLFPFTRELLDDEIERLEERTEPRKIAKV
jgi:CheY-like chemotaxis protein